MRRFLLLDHTVTPGGSADYIYTLFYKGNTRYWGVSRKKSETAPVYCPRNSCNKYELSGTLGGSAVQSRLIPKKLNVTHKRLWTPFDCFKVLLGQ